MIPDAITNTGANRAILCFLKLANANPAAIKCTNIELNSAHRNTWYHISAAYTY